jgi:predicted DNA-binding transcriptional regulator AlpA
MSSQIQSAVFKKKDAARFCGISTATLDRLRAAGEFVRPIQLGTQAIGFLRADVEGWIASRPVLAHYTMTL